MNRYYNIIYATFLFGSVIINFVVFTSYMKDLKHLTSGDQIYFIIIQTIMQHGSVTPGHVLSSVQVNIRQRLHGMNCLENLNHHDYV